MAVLQRTALARFLNQPTTDYRIILVFGPDRGLVSERAEGLLDRLDAEIGVGSEDPFGRTRISADELQSDPALLANEAYTISLFGSARIIHVKGTGARNLPQQIDGLLKTPPEDSFIVIEAGDLKKSAALRKQVERSQIALAIPCYADDHGSLNMLIDEEIRKYKVSISKDARQRLLSQIGGDRLASRGEVEKICLYAVQKGHIDEEDVLTLTGDSSVLSADALGDAAALGQISGLLDAVARMDAGNFNAQAAGPQVLRNFQILHKARGMVEQGMTPAQVVDRITPPIFFKRKDAVRRQLSLWTVKRLDRALQLISDAILISRQQPVLASAHLADALIRIANAAKQRA